MIPRIAFPLLVALALWLPSPVEANPTPKPYIPHHTVIESVSADSITITSASGDKTYKITNETEITFKGDTVTADKLEAGMRVQVTPDSSDEGTAGRIEANDPPKEAPSPKP